MASGGGNFTPGSNASSRAPTPTPSTAAPKTTRRTAQPTKLNVEEIKTRDKYAVKNAKGGGAFLEKSLLSLVGEPFTLEHLATTLFHITQMDKMPLQAVEAVRAVAFLLEEEATLRMAKQVISHVTEGTSDTIATQVIIALSPHIATLHNNIELLASEVKSLQQLPSPSPLPPSSPLESTQPADNQTKTYSAALKSNTYPPPQPASTAVARAALKDRQVLLDPQGGHSLHTEDTPTATLAEKLTEAINGLRETDSPPATIKAITKLRNGGLIIEFDSALSAKWIQTDGVRERFLATLKVPTDIKTRTYPILVPFLPISSSLDDKTWLRTVELENNLNEGSLKEARWVKSIERRSETQRVAHAIFSLTNPDAANLLLRDGLYVHKEKLHPRKDKREPLRCVRCQGWGHIARNCKASQDTCAKCSHSHRTSDCTEAGHYCANCRVKGHGSNDPSCPTYLNKRADLDAKHPENSMPYFPTADEWTQVMLPPKPSPPLPPPRRTPTRTEDGPPTPTPVPMRQTTLNGTARGDTTGYGYGAPPGRGGPSGRGGQNGHGRTTQNRPAGRPLPPTNNPNPNSIPLNPRRRAASLSYYFSRDPNKRQTEPSIPIHSQ